jgi:membrane protein YdbS with pleckstrin-like domain
VRLRPPRNPVDRRAIGWWRVHVALTALVPVGLLAILAAAIAAARAPLLIATALAALLGVVAVVALPLWWYRMFRWEVTDAAVYTRSAVLWEELRIAPISRIQTVDTMRGPLEQAFGLATVTVTTASAKGALRIEGLDHATAAELVEHLTAVTQATPDDAT